jgi:hypothetical protein
MRRQPEAGREGVGNPANNPLVSIRRTGAYKVKREIPV